MYPGLEDVFHRDKRLASSRHRNWVTVLGRRDWNLADSTRGGGTLAKTVWVPRMSISSRTTVSHPTYNSSTMARMGRKALIQQSKYKTEVFDMISVFICFMNGRGKTSKVTFRQKQELKGYNLKGYSVKCSNKRAAGIIPAQPFLKAGY